MSASQATIGYGAKFFTGAPGSPITYTEVVESAVITPNDFTVGVIDVTHLNSPSATKENIPGLVAPGTIEVMGNFTGVASQLALDALAVGRTIFPWKITAPATATTVLTMTGTGFITKLETGPFETEKKTDLKFSVQITGPITKVVV